MPVIFTMEVLKHGTVLGTQQALNPYPYEFNPPVNQFHIIKVLSLLQYSVSRISLMFTEHSDHLD